MLPICPGRTPIVMDSLRYYPLENIAAAAKETAEQLVRFGIADFIFRFPAEQYVAVEMKAYSAPQYAAWMASRQQQGELKSHGIALFHQCMIAIYVLLCFGVLQRARGGEPYRPVVHAIYFMLAAIAANAAITGVFSHAESRYESRLIWLIPLCAAAGASVYFSRRFPCATALKTSVPTPAALG